MTRPKGSLSAKAQATSFALAVTTPSQCQKDLVARSGRHSIFALFFKLSPKVRVVKIKPQVNRESSFKPIY
jgi:hypothetical protein